MTKKASFILSLFSILSPVLLILLVILITLTENFFRTIYIYNLSLFLIFWIFAGWIFGLCTGILGLVSSIRLKKDKVNTSGVSFICILGILFNSL